MTANINNDFQIAQTSQKVEHKNARTRGVEVEYKCRLHKLTSATQVDCGHYY